MEISGQTHTEKRFSSPEEELNFLREKVAETERNLAERGETGSRERIVREKIDQYKQTPAEEILHKKYQIAPAEAQAIILDLSPEEHDEKVSELVHVMRERGIKNALTIVSHMGNPHLTDDFERYLVQYIKAGYDVQGMSERDPLFKALNMTLYEITLPEHGKDEKEKALKELVSSMEQFYSGMTSVSEEKKGPSYFTLELAVANHSDEFIFYSAVPDGKKKLFEKQILSIFHNAKIVERKDDYNIFNEAGTAVASIATIDNFDVLPLKTYEQFDHDPLNVILNSFSKIDRDGEGAAIQIMIKPAEHDYVKEYRSVHDRVAKGMELSDAVAASHEWKTHIKEIGKELFGIGPTKQEKEEKEKKSSVVDQIALEQIKNKLSSQIVEANIRIIASSNDEKGANEILADLESAFNQFENTHGNKLNFEQLKGGKLKETLDDFSFRTWSKRSASPLSLKELTSIMHLPSTVIKTAPQLKISKAGSAPAPLGLPTSGILMGVNIDRNVERKIFMAREDRLRHFYCIGQTGTGKTTLLKNMIAQDILNGEGVCMIDPHGTDIKDVLAVIPPDRYEDVIYFDPGYTSRPMGLNMLEYDVRYPEQKTFVVNEMLSIFNKLFDMKVAGGPMFEQYFRNAVLLVLEDPDSGNTLIDVSRVLSDKKFRDMKISRCHNPIVIEFWRGIAEKAGGEGALANIVPYITSKFDTFLSNEIMRPIIAQEKSTFNFREIMDSRKILLVNLSKGRLGDLNSHLIGLVLVGKILMAALSRVDSLSADTPPFYLYIDEFQNVTTDSISTILSEARKYKLSLNIAHQFIKQLEEKIKDAVFGNVGSLAMFRVGSEDAEFLQKQLEPVFTAKDLINLDNHNAYLKLLVNGRPVKPFNIETIRPPKGNPESVDKLQELSYLKFGRERKAVEAEVMARYAKPSVPVTQTAEPAVSPNSSASTYPKSDL